MISVSEYRKLSTPNLISNNINKRKIRHIYSEIVRHTAAISFDYWKSITSSNNYRPCFGHYPRGDISRGTTGNKFLGSDLNFKYKKERKKKK